jgi:hypothetical protein
MVTGERYRQYAADCVRQAQSEATTEDKTIMLNVALAWFRLAEQSEAHDGYALGGHLLEGRIVDGHVLDSQVHDDHQRWPGASPPLAPAAFDLDEAALFNKIAR